MKNMFKSNKKGFTLVELLAVIVILALLIVITANTVLPMMNKSKQSGMVTYAERVLNNASSAFQADIITGTSDGKGYSIEKIMGNDSYFGCVYVDATKLTTDSVYEYTIVMYSESDNLQFTGKTTEAVFSGELDDYVLEYEGTRITKASYTEDACKDAPTYDDGEITGIYKGEKSAS